MNSEFYIDAVLRQAKPRLSTLLKLMFSEAQAFGQHTLWLGSVIDLVEPLGIQERTIRTALFRLAEHGTIRIERHGRRSLCMLTAPAAATLLGARQRLNIPAERNFGENWTMLVNSGGVSAAAYASARKQLQELEYCALAPNLLARPSSYVGGTQAGGEHGLALFEVSGTQLAAAVRQPLFGKVDWDLETPAALYEQFQQRFLPLRQMLEQRGALTDQQAFVVRLLVSHGYQQCRGADPLLPLELLPESWPAMAAYQTYLALYSGCAAQARRHLLKLTARPSPEPAALVVAPMAAPAPAAAATVATTAAAPLRAPLPRRTNVYLTA